MNRGIGAQPRGEGSARAPQPSALCRPSEASLSYSDVHHKLLRLHLPGRFSCVCARVRPSYSPACHPELVGGHPRLQMWVPSPTTDCPNCYQLVISPPPRRPIGAHRSGYLLELSPWSALAPNAHGYIAAPNQVLMAIRRRVFNLCV